MGRYEEAADELFRNLMNDSSFAAREISLWLLPSRRESARGSIALF